MPTFAQQLLEDVHNNCEQVEEITRQINEVLARGNKPVAAMADNWDEAIQESKRVLEILRTLDKRSEIFDATQDEINALMVASLRFRQAQEDLIEPMARVKRALGMIP